MSPCLCIVLAASLAAGPTPGAPVAASPLLHGTSVPEFDRLERRMHELREQERFEELAREGEAAFASTSLQPSQRRTLAFFAVRGLQGMSEASGEPAGLCRARALLARVEREVGFGDDVGNALRLRDATEKALRATGSKDPCAAPRTRTGAAANSGATPARLLPVKADGPPAPAPQAAVEPPEPLIDVSGTTRPPRPHQLTRSEPVDVPAPVEPSRPDEPARPRGRLIAGSVLIVGGAALLGGMTAALVRRAVANDNIVKLSKTIDSERREATPEELAVAFANADTFRRMTPVAGITGALGTAAVLTGAILLAVPPRDRRTAVNVSATPWSATFTLSGRF